ncbi:MAG: hypothetical protein ACFHWX_01135 [Bacteroidota bacterium]
MAFMVGDRIKANKNLKYGDKTILKDSLGKVKTIRKLPSGLILDYEVHFKGDKDIYRHVMDDDISLSQASMPGH